LRHFHRNPQEIGLHLHQVRVLRQAASTRRRSAWYRPPLPSLPGHGMNVAIPFQDDPHAFSIAILISILLSSITACIFWKKRFFQVNETDTSHERSIGSFPFLTFF
jgi:hypothetical protein